MFDQSFRLFDDHFGDLDVPLRRLVDRYGLSWQIVPRAYLALMASLDDDGRARAASALMKQRKIDVDALRAAAEG